jgi:FlaA1/EpsC-like NDP-sugar epimerase
MSSTLCHLYSAQYHGRLTGGQKMFHTRKIPFLILSDGLILCGSLIASAAIKYDSLTCPFLCAENIPFFVLLCCAAIIINAAFGCYRCIWKFAGASEALRQTLAALAQFLFFIGALTVYNMQQQHTGKLIPFSFAFLCVIIQFVLMCTVRFASRINMLIHSKLFNFLNRKTEKKIVIFGKIQDSKAIIEKLCSDKGDAGNVVCMISAEPMNGKNCFIGGIKVYSHGFKKLEEYVKKFKADEIVISKNDVEKDLLLKILKLCSEQLCELKVYAGIESYQNGIRSINVNDLLGRSPITPEKQQICNFVKGKTILVTGGAGSIGSEICRQALEYNCSKLIIFDINENGLFEVDYELKNRFSQDRYITVVGSVRDAQRLDEIFMKYRPDTVFHAAAHKHVPMMEINPGEAIKNNVIGTYNVAKKAMEYGTGSFILISTDKAVNPVNVMGATKRAAEMIVQSMNMSSGKTKFAAVRFGNVLDSNGSVVPIFRRQIMSGGPVTVTHPDMERYFMTIAEAVQLVMQAVSMEKGGEIYVLDMGMPVKIVDLASAMIRLYGLEPGSDIKIKYTGLRPGEKMREKLVLDEETSIRTQCSGVFICESSVMNKDFMEKLSVMMETMNTGGNADYKMLLKEMVEQYDPAKAGNF